MDVEIRTISEDEFATYARAVELAFSDVPSDEDIERERVLVEYDRSFAAFDGPDIVGTWRGLHDADDGARAARSTSGT